MNWDDFEFGDRVMALSTSPWWEPGMCGQVREFMVHDGEKQGARIVFDGFGYSLWACDYEFKKVVMNLGDD